MKTSGFPAVGPATMVTAAFIGPGTVISCSLAGAHFGYALLWALLFAVCASVILQEMAARLGIVTGQGLGENIRRSFRHRALRWAAIALVASAIAVGNAAYQGGNLAGAGLGLAALAAYFPGTQSWPFNPWPLPLAAVAFALLWRGSYLLIERVLIGLVLLMSIAFVLTAAMTRPDLSALIHGLLVPEIPSGVGLTVIALIGTTVVPYNLYLHSASAAHKWRGTDGIAAARRDIWISIPLGGLISIAIVATTAAAFFGRQVALNNAADIAVALQPLFGHSARYLMGIGLFAAGISSALTAPLAAAYALCGVLGQPAELKSPYFRGIWLAVLGVGTWVAALGIQPVTLIWFAQIANGLALPVSVAFLLWTMNSSRLGHYRNSLWQNILGLLVLLATLLLGGRSLLAAAGQY